MSFAKETIKAINRVEVLPLAVKRILRIITRQVQTALDAVEAATAAGIASIELYGGDLIYGSVTWISGLTFEVSECKYIIDNVTYISQPTTITLDAADVTNPRIDVIYVDTDGQAGKISGTAAADPAKPEVDQNTQLELTFVNVAANATTPTNITATLLYGEDAGDPTEWDATADGATIDDDSTVDPYAGTKHIQFISAASGDGIDLDAGAGNELTVGDMTFLECHLKAVNWASNKRLRVAFYNGANRISDWILIRDGVFGFDRTNSTSYQTVAIPSSDFNFTAPVADKVRFEVSGGGGANFSAYLDQVRSQVGGGVPVFNGLTEDELINNVRTFNAQQPFGADALTDAANISWDLDVSPIATVTLDGNRTLDNPSNIRAGGTYILKVKQDDTTGSRTLAYGSAFLWPGGTAPTLSTAVDSEDILTFVSFDGTNLYGVSSLDFS